MKCKVIRSIRENLEDNVNNWLSTGTYEISNMVQTEGEHGYITLTIFYMELKEIRKKKISKLNNLLKN